ncbi:hypothetical protein [Alloprevotella sp. OH1205_COT-284]|uniref:hypothetical protein n=1 Tax=Alloprevotella sp. OH1205_COT-284 TaxID=2491043 RepID=UPI001315123B|nr:hypothetical protein [Alloprevotella sp. OH1205_COT-284]
MKKQYTTPKTMVISFATEGVMAMSKQLTSSEKCMDELQQHTSEWSYDSPWSDDVE